SLLEDGRVADGSHKIAIVARGFSFRLTEMASETEEGVHGMAVLFGYYQFCYLDAL
ncbi:unnamed protein product, partial [Brassica oleracea var. botrytis]